MNDTTEPEPMTLERLAAVLSAPQWLVWSNEHAAWWGPSRRDYYRDISHAGRYSLEEAIEISQERGITKKRRTTGNPSELIQPAPEWIEARNDVLRLMAMMGMEVRSEG